MKKILIPSRGSNISPGMDKLYASEEGFDPNYTYFLLHASYGDKWCILSYLHLFLKIQQRVTILANKSDRDLVRIFFTEEEYRGRFVFIPASRLNELSDKIIPISLSSAQIWADFYQLTQVDAVIDNGFPHNIIRHLHIVKYSYFSDLHIIYGVSYGTLLKSILYLPADASPRGPINYLNEDIRIAREIADVTTQETIKGKILFNVVNFSQKRLTEDQIKLIADLFIEYGFYVFINISQHSNPGHLTKIFEEQNYIKFVDIPSHLLALFCNEMSAVVGVVGGAMNVAVQFAQVDCLGFLSDGVGFKRDMKTIYGGLYRDNIWKFYDQDWHFFNDTRLLENFDIADPAEFSKEELVSIISNFCEKLIGKKAKAVVG